ncbi:glycosyltransferase [Bdellovibrio sp.]|uniref:glycosyltransferase n=1 Tax=Bdellovibrio sp. TaxID=28201 RepID=UPI0039E52465
MSMVFGEGMIANRFRDYSLQTKYLIFAGNVNDSSIKDETIFQKEEHAISSALKNHPEKTFVYFSSCSTLDADTLHSEYTKHKIRMESKIRETAKSFLIVRLPQVLGLSDADSSLINYYVSAISEKRHFELWSNARKNFIDIDDVHDIVGELLKRNTYNNKIVNIASSRQTSTLEVVHIIEDFLGVSASFTELPKGTTFEIDISEIKSIIIDLKINFDRDYIKKSLTKYYSHLKGAPKLLSVIVPTYNEEHGIEEFYRRTKSVLVSLAPRFSHEIIFVNDFSTDNTLEKIRGLAKFDSSVKVINFSKNFGNQIGITAGIDFSRGDIAVIIDDDLQDPPEIILNLISKWDKGYKVVYGVRPKRQGVGFLFKLIAKMYYRTISSLSDTKIPNDTGDFRLIDRVVIEALKQMKEESRYYRGMVAWVGFSQIGVEYERDKRYAGVSTFSLKKYINFALNGLTSFTEKPLYFSSLAGVFVTFISFLLAVTLIIKKIADPSFSIRGWTSLTVIILFFGGIQLLSIGILGIYISKVYREIKGRPLYIVESTENIDSGEQTLTRYN